MPGSKKEVGMANKGEQIMLVIDPDPDKKPFPRPKTVSQLLEALHLEAETALVARDGKLLTPDRRIWPGDEIWVRVVASRG